MRYEQDRVGRKLGGNFGGIRRRTVDGSMHVNAIVTAARDLRQITVPYRARPDIRS